MEQFFRLALQHLGNGNAGPAGDELGDVFLVHRLADFLLFEPLILGLVIFFFQLKPFRLELCRLLEVLSLRGSFLLIGQLFQSLFQ